jgi:hypothetical protein
MSKLAGISRAALLGTLCAMVAFSYAIATVESASVADSVDARGVGTNQLRFTNPLLNGDRDLGLVALGGSFTRFARAAGGLPPYTFSSPTGASEFGITRFVGTTLVSGAVDFSGKVSGVVGTIAGGSFVNPLNGALRFNIKVVDQTVGTAGVTEVFNLTVDQTGVFKFAVGPDLGTTPRLQDFNTTIETIYGKGSISFAVTSVSGITGVTALSDVGLFLDRTGKLFGKPYLPGTLTFTVEATDSTGAKAKARDGTGSSQAFSLVIEPGVDVTSDIVVQKATVKYDQVKSAKKAGDSVQISGLLNVKGAKLSDFTGKKFSTQIGNFVSTEVTLDGKGKTNDKTVNKTANVAVSTKGTFKASYKALNISALFATPAVADKASQAYATAVNLSASVSAVDTLIYAAKGTFPKQQLSYALGKNAAPAGAFLITKVSGKNNKEGNATAYKADYIGLPGSLVKSVAGTFTGVSKSSVSIGNVTDATLVATVNGTKVSAKSKSKANNTVKSVSLDSAKGKGKVDTNPFVAGVAGTGIPIAADGVTTKFPLAVAVQNSANANLYNGIGSVSIFGKKSSYVSVNPAK